MSTLNPTFFDSDEEKAKKVLNKLREEQWFKKEREDSYVLVIKCLKTMKNEKVTTKTSVGQHDTRRKHKVKLLLFSSRIEGDEEEFRLDLVWLRCGRFACGVDLSQPPQSFPILTKTTVG